jgi:nitrite reductase/ring-hydroxylating ferredoxin subunit
LEFRRSVCNTKTVFQGNISNLIQISSQVKPVSEVTEDKGIIFEHDDLKIAVFKHEEKFYAMNNWCPHAFGPLYLGEIEDLPYACGNFDALQRGQITRAELPSKPAVICPYHGWAFFLETGGNHYYALANSSRISTNRQISANHILYKSRRRLRLGTNPCKRKILIKNCFHNLRTLLLNICYKISSFLLYIRLLFLPPTVIIMSILISWS